MRTIWLVKTNGFGGSGLYICIVYARDIKNRDEIIKKNKFHVHHLTNYQSIGQCKTKKTFLSVLDFDDPAYEG